MSVPAISLYATPPECDLNPRYFSSYTASSSYPHKPAAIIGGLSRLFSTPPAFSASFEDLRHDSWEEIKSSFCYKSRDQSPVSAFQFPISCGRRSPSPLDWSFLDGRGSREDLLKCFVGNALSSCLDYNSSSFPVSGGFDDDDDADLTFNLEEGFTEGQSPSCEPFVMNLLSGAQSKHEIFHEEMVKKAFFEAEKAHRGQRRMSGDPYLQHCVETAVLLALIGANTTVVAAGLLHDTIDDSFADYNYILTIFGAGVADLVEEVSKLSQLSKLSRESNTASRTVEADRLHTIYLAMADARAVLIKLADRLHNMMTLEVLPEAKQQRFAKETLEIFAPLANRLGISSWKEQLENICFKYLHPEEYNELSCKLLRTFDEAKITHSKEKLEHALKNYGLSYHVLSGRHKSLFGIYSKMIKKKLTMDEIHDIHGLRLIVEEEEDCYRALNIVHKLWPDILGRLKDYITHPKDNGYQSLHTVVMSEDKLPLEVQIRTKEMHLQAECGFAAHWRYKEGDCKHSSYILQMVEWARWVMTWQCEMIDAEKPSAFRDARSGGPACSFSPHRDDFLYSYALDEPVFIIMLENEKMSVQEFAPNSTVMDLLERFGRANRRDHLNVFAMKEELRPRLNHEHVSKPTQKLRMGDVVELTPAIPRESLTEYREEIKRMYDRGLSVSSPGVLTSS